ncbi:uncharacterized protein LOC105206926 isoform X2 [Solenopsis invicta]|nr:uncharacterized protein LOC105206926 isoform X2 [Solenopsis invicta]XP_025993776.2 uncharacterized protein LOC105206926 isoform X2 [Solenopsis invicta]XP_039302561.1 uncharacterized protein LOC105206926 isoform X2 [Solenopsis invicta]XP_039302562.1 uncharacterized protein LOC105206926 isoform X2 [Solenopsis invicta]
MYMSSISSFAASWLLLCFIIPFYSGAESSGWVSYEINPVHHQLRPIPPESVSLGEQPKQPNIVKPSQYNVYRSKHNLMQPRIPSKSHQDNLKQNERRFMPEYQLGKVYRPYYAQFEEDQKTRKEESAERLEHEEIREIDEEVMKKMNMLDKVLSEDTNMNDVENTVEDEIIAEMNISEETKRVARQVRKQRPGFFWTLARLAFETFNDTRSAIKQITGIINQTIEPDSPTRRPGSRPSMVAEARTIAPSVDKNNTSSMADVNATMTTTTTTPAPFRLTPTNIRNLILRNVRGLVRLFNIEWQDALNQSEITVKEFQKDLGNQVGIYLQDNPNAF